MVTDAGKKAFGMSQHVTDATMRARDVIYEGLLIRRGLELTEEVARERANNIATAVIEALRQLAEESKPPPAGRVARHLEDIEETADEHAKRVIR